MAAVIRRFRLWLAQIVAPADAYVYTLLSLEPKTTTYVFDYGTSITYTGPDQGRPVYRRG